MTSHRGGPRTGAGRKPKSGETRIQKSVNLTPRAWSVVAASRREGESESDTLERLLSELLQADIRTAADEWRKARS